MEKIKEVFRLSEVITDSGQSMTPIYKLRENATKFGISESDMRKYLMNYPQEYHEYIEQILQKIYHPTEENLRGDDILRTRLTRFSLQIISQDSSWTDLRKRLKEKGITEQQYYDLLVKNTTPPIVDEVLRLIVNHVYHSHEERLIAPLHLQIDETGNYPYLTLEITESGLKEVQRRNFDLMDECELRLHTEKPAVNQKKCGYKGARCKDTTCDGTQKKGCLLDQVANIKVSD
jgi:hypothetical protein|nr:MAG TPA: Transcription termination factor [Bacteriophage sp.]